MANELSAKLLNFDMTRGNLFRHGLNDTSTSRIHQHVTVDTSAVRLTPLSWNSPDEPSESLDTRLNFKMDDTPMEPFASVTYLTYHYWQRKYDKLYLGDDTTSPMVTPDTTRALVTADEHRDFNATVTALRLQTAEFIGLNKLKVDYDALATLANYERAHLPSKPVTNELVDPSDNLFTELNLKTQRNERFYIPTIEEYFSLRDQGYLADNLELEYRLGAMTTCDRCGDLLDEQAVGQLCYDCWEYITLDSVRELV